MTNLDRVRLFALGLTAILAAACGDYAADLEGTIECSIPLNEIFIGQAKDGIPALTNPPSWAWVKPARISCWNEIAWWGSSSRTNRTPFP